MYKNNFEKTGSMPICSALGPAKAIQPIPPYLHFCICDFTYPPTIILHTRLCQCNPKKNDDGFNNDFTDSQVLLTIVNVPVLRFPI